MGAFFSVQSFQLSFSFHFHFFHFFIFHFFFLPIVDNASIHHGEDIEELLEEFGVVPLYLPAYSPGWTSFFLSMSLRALTPPPISWYSYFGSILRSWCFLVGVSRYADLNPIELSYSWVKQWLSAREDRISTEEFTLESWIFSAFASLPDHFCFKYFCEYGEKREDGLENSQESRGPTPLQSCSLSRSISRRSRSLSRRSNSRRRSSSRDQLRRLG